MAQIPEPVGGITFDPRGRIFIDLEDADDSPRVVLRRPKYWQLKELLLAWDDSVADYNAELVPGREAFDKRAETIEKMAVSKRDAAREEFAAEVAAWNETMLEALRRRRGEWWQHVAKLLADPTGPQLPENIDDWPSELLVASDLPQRAAQLWKFIP